MKRYTLSLLFALLLLLLWEVLCRLLDIPSFILPPPTGIARALWEHAEVLFLVHLPVTLGEVLLGLGCSLALGVLTAVGMYFSPLMERIFYPITVISQTIPIIALSPVFILWFGYSIWSKVAVTVLITFFPIVVNTFDGLRSTPRAYQELLETMGASRWQVFRKVAWPNAYPMIFSGLKVAVVMSVIGATIGEWLGASSGLGYFGRRMANSVRAEPLFASIVILSLLGVLLFVLVNLLERKVVHWKKREATE